MNDTPTTHSSDYLEGWRAFERGHALSLSLDGFDYDFAQGWLEAAKAAFGILDD